MLGSCSVYIALARAYMICYDRYSNLDRQFRSPLGKWAAYWVVAVYSLMMVCLAFFQEDDYVALAVFAGFICLGWLYYHLVAHKREYFSEEEQKTFMRAYILNANYKRRVAFTGSSLRRYKSYVLSSAFSSKRNSGRSDGPSVVSKVASLRVSNKPGESVLLVEEARDETFVSLTNDRVASVDLVDSDKSAELSLHLPIHPHVSYSSSICMMDLHNEGKREEFFN
eukprot:scaffold14727_cov201-Ochromonas_danica.AAC.1